MPRSLTLKSWPAVHSPAWTSRRAAGFLAERDPMLRSVSGESSLPRIGIELQARSNL